MTDAICLLSCRLLAVRETVVLVPCRAIDQEAGRVDLGGHVRDHPLDGLERGNGLTELNPLLGVGDGGVKCPLGDPQSLGGDPDAPITRVVHRRRLGDPAPVPPSSEPGRGQ